MMSINLSISTSLHPRMKPPVCYLLSPHCCKYTHLSPGPVEGCRSLVLRLPSPDTGFYLPWQQQNSCSDATADRHRTRWAQMMSHRIPRGQTERERGRQKQIKGRIITLLMSFDFSSRAQINWDRITCRNF